MKVFTVGRNAVRPSYFPVMTRKVYLRARYGTTRERAAATSWAAGQEALAFADELKAMVGPRVDELTALGVDLGGGGCHELLYFLTRLRRPHTVLETGVAAGWSTTAFLSAIRDNGSGHLFSSDFPYFRLPDPEHYVGYIVPDEIKRPWTLYTKGDRRNLDLILHPGVTVDLAHYDSDKSRGGREFFLRRLAAHLAPDAVVVMDDINDNLVFREYVRTHPEFKVFEYHGKYIGLTGI
jgi:predicted O-methyltransferase YrrM